MFDYVEIHLICSSIEVSEVIPKIIFHSTNELETSNVYNTKFAIPYKKKTYPLFLYLKNENKNISRKFNFHL